MQKALRGVEEALSTNTINRRRSSSDDSMRSDVGKFMDMPSNPDPVTRYSVGENKHAGGGADHLATAKIHALSSGIEAGDKLTGTSMQDSPSRFDDDDYFANMVADIKRRRRTKEMQKSYWQRSDLKDREEVDGKSTTLHIDDEMDNSTLSGTCYSDGEGEDCTLGELCGLFERQQKICLGNVRDEISKHDTRKRRSYNKKNGRKLSTRREGSTSEDVTLEGTVLSGFTREDVTLEGTVLSGFTREDVTLGDTVLSGYTREDSTLAGTLLSESSRGETIMSGSTEYEMAALERPPLLAEPNYLVEDDHGREDELASNKAFYLIHNICSAPWFRSNDNKQSSQGEDAKAIEGETNAKESDVVKERLNRTRSKQSEVAAVDDLKKSESLNKSMTGTALVRTPTQSELKAMYKKENRLTDGKKPHLPIKDKELDNQQRNELNRIGCDESAKPATDRKKKSLRHKLFSFRRMKTGRLKVTAPSMDASATPVSPARTVATGTSDASTESKSREEDDDVCTSYAALAMTRTKSKILISI